MPAPSSPRRKRKLPVLLLVVVAAVIGRVALDRWRTPEGPNIVVVLVDQLRKDATDRWMPEVSALANEGVRFEGMRAAAPWTYPSVVSMFSGLYPQQHGADGPPLSGRLLSTFDEAVPMLPRILRGAGYYTAGFVTNPFLQKWNPFHTGFDHYAVDEFIGTQGPMRGNPDAVWTQHMFADSVNAAITAHFDERPPARPEFTYVHYIDVHGPWDGAPFDAGGVDHRDSKNQQPGIDRAYEVASRYVDVKIRELYDYFMERYGGDLVFIVTSDHGQQLGDDLLVGEGSAFRRKKATVHDFNTHIPFLLLPSERVSGGRSIATPCSNVDVTPTLLDWAGLESPPTAPGVSLLPAIRGEGAMDETRAVYSLMSAFKSRNDCVVLGTRKLMRHFDPATGEVITRAVFDLAADPRELSVVTREFGAAGSYLQTSAGTGLYDYPRSFEPPDEETLERLQGLGYLGGE
jgi:arylsulfatase A-like enzyme